MDKKKEVNATFKKIINIISLIIFIVLFLFFAIFTYNIFKLNILPLKYVILVIAIELLIVGGACLILVNKKIKWKIKLVISILAILFMLALGLGNHYIGSTISFFKNITGNNIQTENYYVIALKENNYNNINDLKDKTIEYIETSSIIEALTKLDEKLTYKQIKAESLEQLSIDLLEKKVDAIYLADYNKTMLDEQNEQFMNNTKIIETITLEKESEIDSKDVNITKEAFNILISGIDTYGDISTIARSDVNMLVTINPKSKEVVLTSIPRDYYVTLPKFGEKDKLTHAGFYGVDASIGAIENLLDIKINYYLKVNFSTLMNLVDVLDGITVNSEYSFNSSSHIYFKKGENYLNGEKALAFARERHSFIDGDRQRGKNQQIVIKAIVNKMTSPAILNKYSDVLKALEGTFQTNLETSNIQELIKFQIDKMPNWNINTISLNGSDSYNTTYSFGAQRLYVMVPNEKTITNAKKIINDTLDGKIVDVNIMK